MFNRGDISSPLEFPSLFYDTLSKTKMPTTHAHPQFLYVLPLHTQFGYKQVGKQTPAKILDLQAFYAQLIEIFL